MEPNRQTAAETEAPGEPEAPKDTNTDEGSEAAQGFANALESDSVTSTKTTTEPADAPKALSFNDLPPTEVRSSALKKCGPSYRSKY